MATEGENQCANPNLPDDIIFHILSALPVKTLLRFRSVCKSWRSLISSSRFTKTHLSKSTNDPYYINYGLIFCDWNHCHCFGIYMDPRTYSFYSLFEKSKTGILKILEESEDEREDDAQYSLSESKNRVGGEIFDESEDYFLYSLFDEFEDYCLYSLFDESKAGDGEILDESENYSLYSLFDESKIDESEDYSLCSLFDESNTGVVGEILGESEDECDDDSLYSLDESKDEEDDSFCCMRWRIVDGDKLITRFDSSTQGDIQIRYVVGYCNGLVCLACGIGAYDIYLWNPATRNIRKLPNLQPRNFENMFIVKCYCGFCYDELNDTFKVYSVYRSYYSKYEVSVYSSKSDSWRLIGDFPFNGELSKDTVLETPPIFANGALHWVVVDDRSDEEPRIVSLDINTEMYQEIMGPKYEEEEEKEEKEEGFIMSNLGNSLSLLCNFNSRADLWVLKKCGVEEIWTKLCTIPYMDTVKCFRHIKPICILENGDLMLLYNYRTILRYNSKNSTFDELFVMNFRHYISKWYEADVYTYVESLVSP